MHTVQLSRGDRIEFAQLSPRVQEIVQLAISHAELLSQTCGVTAEFHCPQLSQSHVERVKVKVTLHLQGEGH